MEFKNVDQSKNKLKDFILAEAETPILWLPDVKNWLIGKDPDVEKDERQEKGLTEDEMVGWHHRLNGQEFEQVPEVGDGQGSLECCSLRGHKELDTTEWLNWTEPNVRTCWWIKYGIWKRAIKGDLRSLVSTIVWMILSLTKIRACRTADSKSVSVCVHVCVWKGERGQRLAVVISWGQVGFEIPIIMQSFGSIATVML